MALASPRSKVWNKSADRGGLLILEPYCAGPGLGPVLPEVGDLGPLIGDRIQVCDAVHGRLRADHQRCSPLEFVENHLGVVPVENDVEMVITRSKVQVHSKVYLTVRSGPAENVLSPSRLVEMSNTL